MKKLLIFVLMLFSFSGITIFGADVNYNFNITDNFKWNLETGAIESDLKFAITSKMIIGNTDIETIAETYHHVVFWNNKNQYIGYKNTQYSILENAYYLGDIERGNLGFDAPANAHFFSFMIYKSGNRIPDANLNNQSLFNIFGTYSRNNLHTKDNNELDGYDLDDLYNTQLQSKNIFDGEVIEGTISGSTGQIASFTNRTSSVNLIPITPSTDYNISTSGSFGDGYIAYYDTNGTYIQRDYHPTLAGTKTSLSNAYFMRFTINSRVPSDFTYYQVEKGDTATDFEPHENFLTRDYFKDYEQIPTINYTELDNGRLRYVVNQDTIANEFQPLHELNGLSLNDLFDTNNLISNGDFSNGITGFIATSYQGTQLSYSVSNNILTAGLSTHRYLALETNTWNIGNTHYVRISMNATHDYARLNLINAIPDISVRYSGSGNWETVHKKYTVGENGVYDIRLRGYDGTNRDVQMTNFIGIDMTALGIDNLTEEQMDAYYQIYEYFDNGGSDPQTFTYDSPIYYDITYRLDEQFNGLDITAQQFIDFQDGYNRIINNEQVNDFIIYYAVQHAQDNNPTLTYTTEQWEQYYYNYLLFEDANTPYIEELNYYSLKEVFDTNNEILNYDFSNGTTNWLATSSTMQVNNNIMEVTNSTTFGRIYQPNSFTINNLYYVRAEITYSNNGLYPSLPSIVTGNETLVNYIGTATANELIILSGINTPTQSTFRINVYGDIGQISYIDNVYSINLTVLEIDNLNTSQMDGYYDDYTNNQTLEQNLYLSALETGSFSLIQPYYDYTAPAPDDFLNVSPDDFLGNILTDIGFDNDLGKSVLAIVILFFTAFTLFKYNMPNSVIIGVTVLTYVGLTFLGWLPAWINIVIAMIFILLMYLRFKGSGGSGNEENI